MHYVLEFFVIQLDLDNMKKQQQSHLLSVRLLLPKSYFKRQLSHMREDLELYCELIFIILKRDFFLNKQNVGYFHRILFSCLDNNCLFPMTTSFGMWNCKIINLCTIRSRPSKEKIFPLNNELLEDSNLSYPFLHIQQPEEKVLINIVLIIKGRTKKFILRLLAIV